MSPTTTPELFADMLDDYVLAGDDAGIEIALLAGVKKEEVVEKAISLGRVDLILRFLLPEMDLFVQVLCKSAARGDTATLMALAPHATPSDMGAALTSAAGGNRADTIKTLLRRGRVARCHIDRALLRAASGGCRAALKVLVLTAPPAAIISEAVKVAGECGNLAVIPVLLDAKRESVRCR